MQVNRNRLVVVEGLIVEVLATIGFMLLARDHCLEKEVGLRLLMVRCLELPWVLCLVIELQSLALRHGQL